MVEMAPAWILVVPLKVSCPFVTFVQHLCYMKTVALWKLEQVAVLHWVVYPPSLWPGHPQNLGAIENISSRRWLKVNRLRK